MRSDAPDEKDVEKKRRSAREDHPPKKWSNQKKGMVREKEWLKKKWLKKK
jgi:hypothetical protein